MLLSFLLQKINPRTNPAAHLLSPAKDLIYQVLSPSIFKLPSSSCSSRSLCSAYKYIQVFSCHVSLYILFSLQIILYSDLFLSSFQLNILKEYILLPTSLLQTRPSFWLLPLSHPVDKSNGFCTAHLTWSILSFWNCVVEYHHENSVQIWILAPPLTALWAWASYLASQ